jgi:hypothetical protein
MLAVKHSTERYELVTERADRWWRDARPTGYAPMNYLTPELARLLATACTELDRHVNDQGACAECGDPWPCEVACLAAFTLGAL